jgi:hypothetical protein
MPRGELKPERKAAFGVVVAATSLGPIIVGSIWVYNTSNFTTSLSGMFLIIAGVLVTLAAFARNELSRYSPL